MAPGFNSWCDMQMARCKLELGGHDDKAVHAPFAIELNQGCFVGCWFCGVSAEKLTQKGIYDKEYQQEWAKIC